MLDPDLVETVADMADGNSYRVATPDGGTVPGTGDVLAKRWLTELRAATAGARRCWRCRTPTRT